MVGKELHLAIEMTRGEFPGEGGTVDYRIGATDVEQEEMTEAAGGLSIAVEWSVVQAIAEIAEQACPRNEVRIELHEFQPAGMGYAYLKATWQGLGHTATALAVGFDAESVSPSAGSEVTRRPALGIEGSGRDIDRDREEW